MYKIYHLNNPELVDAIKKATPASFNYLYDIYSGALYKAILQTGIEKGSAGEILTKVFVAVYQNIDTYNSNNERLFTWMYKLVLNIVSKDVNNILQVKPDNNINPITLNVTT